MFENKKTNYNFKWTKGKVKEKAKKYKTRGTFQKGNRNAYMTARRHGWLDELFD